MGTGQLKERIRNYDMIRGEVVDTRLGKEFTFKTKDFFNGTMRRLSHALINKEIEENSTD